MGVMLQLLQESCKSHMFLSQQPGGPSLRCLDSSMLSQPSLPYRLVESMNDPRQPAHVTKHPILPLFKKSATDKLSHPRGSGAASRSSRAESFSQGGRFLLFLLLEEDIARLQRRRRRQRRFNRIWSTSAASSPEDNIRSKRY